MSNTVLESIVFSSPTNSRRHERMQEEENKIKCAFKPFALLFIDNALIEAGLMSDVVPQFWKLML